ncbi:MAG: ABC transporter permease subunit [Acidimicrobiales bacterium]
MANHRRLTALVASALFAVAYGWPIVAIVERSLAGVAGRPGLSTGAVTAVFRDARIGRLALVSLGQTVASTVVVVLLGVPIGWVLGRLQFPGRRWLSAIVMTPFVLPTLTVAGAMIALAGGLPRSDVARLALIVAAHVCFNLGIMVRSVAASVAAVPPALEEAAAALGRGPVRSVAGTTLAAIRPAVTGTAIVVAVFCLTSFGVIVALGGASLGTIEVEVWYLSTRSLDLARAAVLAGAQLLVVLALLGWYRRLRVSHHGGVAHALRPARRPSDRMAIVGAWIVAAVVAGLPLAALLVRSFRGTDGWTVDNYRFGSLGWSALGYTLLGAAVATVVAVVLAVPAVVVATRDDRVGRWFEQAMMVPLALSAATLGLGFLVAFSGPTLDLRGTWIVVPLVQGAGAAPVVVRVLLNATRSLDPAPIEAAAVAGAGAARRLVTVVWPACRRAAAVAAGFAFAMSVGEFGATVFLTRLDRPTAPVLIGRLLGRPGSANLGEALALSCALGLIAAISVLLVDRVDGTGPTF